MVTIATKIALSLLSSLLTEAFAKKVVWRLLNMAASKTDNKVDDKLLKDLAEAWDIDE